MKSMLREVLKTDLFRGGQPCYVVTGQDVFGILTIDSLTLDFAKRQEGFDIWIGYTHRIRGRINRFRPATNVEEY